MRVSQLSQASRSAIQSEFLDYTPEEEPEITPWRVPRMAGPGRFPGELQANSERVPSKFRANSGQASQTL